MGDVVIPPVPSDEKAIASQSRISSSPALKPDLQHRLHPGHVTRELVETTETKALTHHEEAVEALVDKVLKVTCTMALILWIVGAIVLSLVTDSGPFYTFIGLSPLLLTIGVTYILIDRYHMESGFLMVFPFIFTGAFLVVGFAGMLGSLDFMTLSTVNIVLGLLFEAILVMQHSFVRREHETKAGEKTESAVERVEETVEVTSEEKAPEIDLGLEITREPKPEEPKVIIVPMDQKAPPLPPKFLLDTDEDVSKFLSNIEDKAKAINAVIGRVYSVRRGGVESLRKKIRIDSEHYNEFNELKDKHPSRRRAAAVRLLKKIKEKLVALGKKEVEVFDKSELESLLKLERDASGNDKVIEVLAKNDSDPVKTYHEGALQFCEDALKDLEAVIEQQKASEPKKGKKPSHHKAHHPASHLHAQAHSHASSKVHAAKKALSKKHHKMSPEKKKHKEAMKKLSLH
ncbi:hypothetical protein JW826_02125 [Candidatus Woesearchaeota archaeon]|nr:hypothetical protein [Candidatus Woesearchaeota archaeon]